MNQNVRTSGDALLELLVQRDLNQTRNPHSRQMDSRPLGLRQHQVNAVEEQRALAQAEARLAAERAASEAARDYRFAKTPEAKLQARARLAALGVKVTAPRTPAPTEQFRSRSLPEVGSIVALRDGSRVRISQFHSDGTFDAEPIGI